MAVILVVKKGSKTPFRLSRYAKHTSKSWKSVERNYNLPVILFLSANYCPPQMLYAVVLQDGLILYSSLLIFCSLTAHPLSPEGFKGTIFILRSHIREGGLIPTTALGSHFDLI